MLMEPNYLKELLEEIIEDNKNKKSRHDRQHSAKNKTFGHR